MSSERPGRGLPPAPPPKRPGGPGSRAAGLRGLHPEALAAGQIDLPMAAVIAAETSLLGPAHRAAVEQHVLRRAAGQTRTELRASVRRAVIAADPDAVRRRQEQAQRDARAERWSEDAGTATRAGRDLPPTARGALRSGTHHAVPPGLPDV